ncbi:hypothetical protein PISMIDRAFT_688656 [Pisolithus microcarpus 441]|uniref:Uncharacterized protein n=1 Tax=Pisolithus microcarpus 441 TaxID=765257 RepID=A0A0C9YI14_9AGAM|nr:hypothetical protein PISMIDRAFT_688656 [Pisolithus microcarpus 441]
MAVATGPMSEETAVVAGVLVERMGEGNGGTASEIDRRVDQWQKHQKKPNTKTIAELVVFLRGLWLEGSVKIKWGRGSVHLEGARAEGIGAPDEGGAGED